MIRNSRRTFSKRLVILNCILAWVAIFYSIYTGQSQYVAIAGLTFIASLGGVYMGVGNSDLKNILSAISSSGKSSELDDFYNGPSMPEPMEKRDV